METNTYLLNKRSGRIGKCRTKSRRFLPFSATIVILNMAEKNRKFCSLLKIAPRFELCFAAIQAARTCPLHVAVSAHFFFYPDVS